MIFIHNKKEKIAVSASLTANKRPKLEAIP